MFFIRHPKPVVDSRAVAVLVVQQKVQREPVERVLIASSDNRVKGQAAAPCAVPQG